MLRLTAVAAFLASASAFAPAAVPSRAVSKTAVSMQMSPSVPFLKQPKALDGSMVGDVGFDPLGLSSVADIKFLREAELKHCRVAMLAAAGSMFQDIATDPSFTKIADGAKMTGLHDKIVAQGGMGQLLVWLGFAEVFGTYALFETLNGKRAPGDFKFDPLGFGKNPEAMKRYQLAEIKNGRLAMLGTGGMVHGYFLTGKGPIELLSNFQAL
jgi:light-harvesting complex I chlorophyll a/b binding protein 1